MIFMTMLRVVPVTTKNTELKNEPMIYLFLNTCSYASYVNPQRGQNINPKYPVISVGKLKDVIKTCRNG